LIEIESLHHEIHRCRVCAEQGFPITPPPVTTHRQAPPIAPARFLLLGQAPSLTDVRVGQTYQGPAGKRLVGWLLQAGFSPDDIGTTVYMTALTKCFPGRLPGKSSDRAPSPTELSNCRPWLDREFGLVKPQVVILFGKMAIDTFLRPVLPLDQRIGGRFEQDGVVYIPLPHSSGASTWLNRPENRSLLADALRLIAEERQRILEG
jgi:uracil-DNA glycosylase